MRAAYPAKRLRKLSAQLSEAHENKVEIAAMITLRDGRFGVAFVREKDGAPEIMLELDLLGLAELLELPE